MQSSLFGDKSRFAIEIRFDREQVTSRSLFGFFFYWIAGKQVGNTSWSELTDIFFSMKWMHGDCGRRDGGRLCGLPPATVSRWWNAVMHDGGEKEYLGFEIPHLPLDVARFSLLFHPANGSDTILLLSCDGIGTLIFDPYESPDIVSIKDDIGAFEEPIREAYSFLSSMHEQLGL